jgi:putative ABC transport system permease protein
MRNSRIGRSALSALRHAKIIKEKVMLKSYLKTAVRSLIRHKTFSFVNILGFAFSISICIVIILYLMKEYSFDRYNTNADNIYRLVDSENNSSGIDYRLKKILVNNYPELKNGCFTQSAEMKINISYKHNGYIVDNILSADKEYFKVFTISFLSGDASNPLPDKNSAVLTESSVRKIFGNENPIGKEILLFNNIPLIVTGIIRDFPDNSSISANIIVNADNDSFKFSFYCTNSKDSSSYRYPFNIYLLFKENTNIQQAVNNINSNTELLSPYVHKINLLPLKNIYLFDNTTGSSNMKGNPALLKILASIALIILILAVMNYINLTVAQQNRRNKETGIRKTIGAGRKEIIFGFLTESVLVTLIAFIIALLIIELSLPYFREILNSKLNVLSLTKFPVNLILIISIFSIGTVSGMGPALILSSFNPVRIFCGNTITSGRKGYLRNLLTVFQFNVSIALIFCIIVIEKQIDYVKHSDLGFNKEQLLRLDIAVPSTTSALVSELKQYSNIQDVTVSFGVPGEVHMTMGAAIQGKNQPVQCISVDSTFLRTLKIKLLMGRELLPGDFGKVCMINEAAYKYFGWKDLVNKKYNNGREGGFEVIGVVKDFHFSSFHKVIEPACIMFCSNWLPNIISIKIKAGALRETMNFINKTWKRIVPDYPIRYQFYDDFFNEMYLKEERFAKAIGLFAILAISISCMGILGLVIFASERRSKEIGIRKVHGAKVNELMYMLNKDFLKWVILASIIALPVGWYAMNKWLQDFAYKTEINWWVFASSVLTALLIAMLTISWHTWRAVNKNPVEVLRYE